MAKSMAALINPTARAHEGRARGDLERDESTGSPNMAFCPFLYLPACIFCTSKSAPIAWQTSQLSPNLGSVCATAWASADSLPWHAVQAEVVAATGLIGPCVSSTLFLPMGKLASELLTWHMSHLAVSATAPVGVMTG